MSKFQFEWDETKAQSNSQKHSITFDEARSTFCDEQAIVYNDPDNSDDEERFILLGTSHKLKQLVVCHCLRENETIIRIISARKADKQESKAYWGNQK